MVFGMTIDLRAARPESAGSAVPATKAAGVTNAAPARSAATDAAPATNAATTAATAPTVSVVPTATIAPTASAAPATDAPTPATTAPTTTTTPPPTATPTRSLLRSNRAFRHVYTAAAISKLGTAVGTLAVPLVAQLTLHASAARIGLLAALNTGAFLLIGLPAGAWIERLRRRPVLIAADLARAVAFGSVPVAAFCGVLTYAWLCIGVAVAGVATVFVDVAARSYLPHVGGRDRLVEANAGLVGMDAAGQIAGRGLGGVLVQALSAAGVVALDAVSYLASALFLMRVRKPEPLPAAAETNSDTDTDTDIAPDTHRNLRAEILEGVRFVVADRTLRPLAMIGMLSNLSIMLAVTLLPTLFVAQFRSGDGPALLGAFLAVGGVGSLLGARLAPWLGRRVGVTRAIWLAGLVTAPISLLIPLVGPGPRFAVAAAAWGVTMARVGVDNVLGVSLRQHAAPEAMSGRINATFRFLLFGALALGSLLAGVIGGSAGARMSLWAGAMGLALVWVPAYPNRRAATSAATSPTSLSNAGASFHCCQYSGTSTGRSGASSTSSTCPNCRACTSGISPHPNPDSTAYK